MQLLHKLAFMGLSIALSMVHTVCGVRRKWKRRVFTKLRGDTAELQVEMDRWRGLRREDRKCAECGSIEVEDVKHFLVRCEAWDRERKELMEKMKSLIAGFEREETGEKRKSGD